MKKFMSGTVLFFLSSLLLVTGAFALDSESNSLSLTISNSEKSAVQFNPAVERVKANLKKVRGSCWNEQSLCAGYCRSI